MEQIKEVWIADDDKSIRWMLEKAVKKDGLKVRLFSDADQLIVALKVGNPDLVLSDIRMPGTEGLDLLAHLKKEKPSTPVIIMTAYADLEKAVSSFSGGAFEYMPKPFDVSEMMSVIRRGLRNVDDVEASTEAGGIKLPEIVGSSTAMQEVFRSIGRLSGSDMTVLLTGESGTGKELVARALHRHSLRADKEFVAINAAAIPKDLLESELFGHERGAFTGADARRLGRFEQANGGTLFLDEIGDMSLDLQARLLRVLASGEFYRVGGREAIVTDVRLIAATNHRLEDRVDEGKFREDLLYRLNVIRMELPPLRERKTDIKNLTNYFVGTISNEINIPIKTFSPEAIRVLENFGWPGNVRQLENICRRLMVMVPGKIIELEDIPAEIRGDSVRQENKGSSDWEDAFAVWCKDWFEKNEGPLLSEAVANFESVLIKVALSLTDGRRQEAAKLIGWGRNTLTRKITELGLED